MSNRHLLSIPVYNEVKYVTGVIKETRRYCSDILVVDDGSTDGTSALLDEMKGIRLIRHPENRGYGKSLADAFCFAYRHDYDWLITMDCDEQHEPAYIPRFQQAILNDDADIISGTRYAEGFDTDQSAPADRRAINREITDLINTRLGLSLTDAFCGFKAYRVSALQHFDITVPGYAMPMQFWVQAVRAKLRIREVSVRLIYNDPTRHFGGILDDPQARRLHYFDVFEQEMASTLTPRLCPQSTRENQEHHLQDCSAITAPSPSPSGCPDWNPCSTSQD